jgi:hypothetical protein
MPRHYGVGRKTISCLAAAIWSNASLYSAKVDAWPGSPSTGTLMVGLQNRRGVHQRAMDYRSVANTANRPTLYVRQAPQNGSRR